MISLESPIHFSHATDPEAAAELAARGNRRRLRVFLAVSVSCLLAGLAFTFSRPAEYRAQARIAVKMASVVADAPAAGGKSASATITSGVSGSRASSLEAEASRLSSRPLIEAALRTVRGDGVDVGEFGADPVQGVQAALMTETVPETNLINVVATGGNPAHLAAILNALIGAYSKEIAESYDNSAVSETSALRQELDSLNQRIAEKRQAVERFRETNNIVSTDKPDNEVLARVKGLSTSLNQANDKVAQAEGRVRSLRESLAAGNAVVRSRDNPSLASLEKNASDLRAALRELERTYTPQFMAMDQNARGLRSRLTELEAQIAAERANSGKASLAEAEDELATARESQRKLQSQLAADRAELLAFSRNFGTFESMQAELAQIEASRSRLSERLVRTETSENSRRPSVQLVEAAVPPSQVWRPDYARDAGISLAVAFVLGLVGMALVEVFNRPPRPSSAPVIVPQSWITMGRGMQPLVAGAVAPPSLMDSAIAPSAQLPGFVEPERELSQAEVARLLQTLDPRDALWVAMLLCGATPAELRGITSSDVDRAAAAVRLDGACARTLHVPPALHAKLIEASGGAEATGPVLAPDSDDEMKRRLLCAAHDAGLDEPASITPQTLRHTCVAYLVRQGLRFGDLEGVVGALSADALAGYARLSPAGVRRAIGEIACLMPALGVLDASAAAGNA